MTSKRMAGLLYGLGAAVIWGGFPVMTRFGVTSSGLDMYDVTFIRFAVASLLTFPVLIKARWPDWRVTGLLTLGIGAPYILVVSDGLARAPSPCSRCSPPRAWCCSPRAWGRGSWAIGWAAGNSGASLRSASAARSPQRP